MHDLAQKFNFPMEAVKMLDIKKWILCAAFCAISTMASAFVENNFEGLYIGVNGGIALGDFKTRMQTPFISTAFDPGAGTYFANPTNAINVSHSGNSHLSIPQAIGGLVLGYNLSFGCVGLIGIEADYSWVDLEGSTFNRTVYPLFPDRVPVTQITVKARNIGKLLLKYGVEPLDGLLTYFTAGAGVTRVTSKFYFQDLEASMTNQKTKTLFGWVLGVGGEYLLCKDFSVSVEYLYSDFGKFHHTTNNLKELNNDIVFPNQPFTTTTNFKTNELRVGLKKYF